MALQAGDRVVYHDPNNFVPTCRVYDPPRLGRISPDGFYVIWDDLPGSKILITDWDYLRAAELADLP